jgi:hypothetical protein
MPFNIGVMPITSTIASRLAFQEVQVDIQAQIRSIGELIHEESSPVALRTHLPLNYEDLDRLYQRLETDVLACRQSEGDFMSV